MDLRDQFAAHFAAALTGSIADAAELSRRAYDLSEAMLVERARRLDAEEAAAIAGELRRSSRAPVLYQAALLDEPGPVPEPEPGYYDADEDPSWMEPYDPTWDLEARWAPEPLKAASSRPPGPGLARTLPEATPADDREERSA
jgi:hypothetical protein